ncbi:MAG: response regulator transcription factor [Chitinophagales bacterium]|nr:response regulator transcription factor [Bacteroidota bacterium]MBP7398410.1 response regulator transcription factor [Chitinophagales bacterium]MBK8680696.1 response regulator transcription factor [Bacteroidota bacterium]MBP8753689.1 response regulator transcription factor [Chitinophagales bacterium]MBP9189161.1 response regulator transcription factor [Chitinophagales bacterium]
MIKCVAIDDEPKAIEIIKNHVSKIEYLQLEHVFTDALKAIKYLQENEIELLFLDINMPDIDGLNFVKHLSKKPMVIFTTAHSEYAIESYEVEAIDFLLKPFDFSRFLVATNKAKERLLKSPMVTPAFFFVSSGNQKIKIVYDDILFIKGDGNYVTYQTKSDKIIVRTSITAAQSELPSNTFIQIHRSTIVSLKWVSKVEDNLVYIAEHKFPISSTYRESFLRAIGTK